MPYETPQLLLRDLLDQVADGRIQLPDFQRHWKWDDERIVSLLATLSMGYPMGVMMALETGGSGTRFKPRPLEGAQAGTEAPDLLFMDGQQRMTSLFQSLRSGAPVQTMDARGKKLRRWYYIDIEKAIDESADREDAILSVDESRVVKSPGGPVELGTVEQEAAAGLYPLRLVFDTPATQRWMRKYAGSDDVRWGAWERFTLQVLDNITQYQIPVIKLTKDTPKEAVCTVFEKVNTGGVPLTVFELVTASYAADPAYFEAHGTDFQLHEEWEKIRRDLAAKTMLTSDRAGLGGTDFLQAVTLVSTYFRRRGRKDADPYTQPAASCKRKDILELPLEEYLEYSPKVVDALHWTDQFLQRECIFQVSDIPYMTQLIALAAIRTVLGEATDTDEAYGKIARWYWCGVLGEQYGGSPETRLPRDLEQVVAWVRGGREPASVGEAVFQEARLGTMRSRVSAAYKGVYALLMRQGCKDWTHNRAPIDRDVFFNHKVDLAQIFPRGWCEKNNVSRDKYASIVNKTLLANRTAQLVGGRAPNLYLRALETDTGLPENWLDDIIATHLIDPSALRAMDFELFYRDRTKRLLELVEAAMGKSAIPAAEAPESGDDYEPEADSEMVA
ncbi:DUF262 domain-containing protein [Spirillospora sp. NPDC052242]